MTMLPAICYVVAVCDDFWGVLTYGTIYSFSGQNLIHV